MQLDGWSDIVLSDVYDVKIDFSLNSNFQVLCVHIKLSVAWLQIINRIRRENLLIEILVQR